MNKFFTKVAVASVGVAMAIGVGVAVGSVKAEKVKADSYAAKSSLSAGDVIFMTYSTSTTNWELTSVTSGTKGNVESFSGTSLKGTYPLTVEVSGDNYYFKDSSNKYIAYTGSATTSNNKLWLVDSSSSDGAAWTVSFSGTNATIKNVFNTSRYLKGNASSGSERICGYTTTGTLTLYSSSGVEPTPEEKYSVIFHANGDGVTGMPSNLTEQYGNVSLADVAHPSRESYTFRGWALTEDGELVTSVNVTTADVDVYAIWSYVDPDAGTPVDIVKGEGKSYDDITVNGTAGCKIGTSSATGTVTITVPASTVYLSVHISGWKDKAVTIGVSVSSGSISPSEHSVKSDSGVTGNSPFTLSGDENDYLYTYDLTGIVEETVVTFTATANYRAVFWTANYKTESVDPTLDPLYVGQVQTGSITVDTSFTVGYSKTSNIYTFSAFAVEDPALASDSIKAINWVVGDPTVVSVDVADGSARVTTLKPGSTTLKAVHSASEKLYNDATVTLTVSKGWLEGITISGSMSKTSYTNHDDWDPSGLVVTASYHYNWEEEISSGISWSYSPAKPEVGVTEVYVSAYYEEDGYDADADADPQSVTVTRVNGIQALYSKAKGTSTGEFYGYYVGFATGSGPIVMDGEYGIMLYNSSQDVSGWTEGETILHVTAGTIDIYNGLYEVKSYTVETVESADVAKPITHTTTGSETANDANRLTNATGHVAAAPTKGSFDGDPAASDIQFTYTVGSNTFAVYYKKAAQTSEVMATLKDSLDNGTEITLKGFTSWYNSFQVTMIGLVEAVESYTAEDFAQDLLDQTDAVCAGFKDGDNNHDELVAIWSDLASADKYPSLPTAEKTILAEAERDESGSVVEQAMARYDYLTGKYNLSNFINGRTPVAFSNGGLSYNDANNNISLMVVIAITSFSVIGFTTLLVIKRRKHN